MESKNFIDEIVRRTGIPKSVKINNEWHYRSLEEMIKLLPKKYLQEFLIDFVQKNQNKGRVIDGIHNERFENKLELQKLRTQICRYRDLWMSERKLRTEKRGNNAKSTRNSDRTS